jgi:hypothetical protein
MADGDGGNIDEVYMAEDGIPLGLKVELMKAQIDQARVDMVKLLGDIAKMQIEADKFRSEMKWEPYKALGAFFVGVAAIGAAAGGGALWLYHLFG